MIKLKFVSMAEETRPEVNFRGPTGLIETVRVLTVVLTGAAEETAARDSAVAEGNWDLAEAIAQSMHSEISACMDEKEFRAANVRGSGFDCAYYEISMRAKEGVEFRVEHQVSTRNPEAWDCAHDSILDGSWGCRRD